MTPVHNNLHKYISPILETNTKQFKIIYIVIRELQLFRNRTIYNNLLFIIK